MADKKKPDEPKKDSKLYKEVWMQWDNPKIMEADVLQVANNEEEARVLDNYFPGKPWFKYTSVASYKDRYLETDSKPVYFQDDPELMRPGSR